LPGLIKPGTDTNNHNSMNTNMNTNRTHNTERGHETLAATDQPTQSNRPEQVSCRSTVNVSERDSGKSVGSTQTPIPLVVSVDWDFFLPTSLDEFDWLIDRQSRESDPGSVRRWHTRAFSRNLGQGNKNDIAYTLLRVDEESVTSFCDQVFADNQIAKLMICDSHKDIVEFTKDLESFNVINFDAHHDVRYDDATSELPELDEGNWAAHLSRSRKLKSYTLVYPKWRLQRPERADLYLAPQIERVVYGGWPSESLKPNRVFVCRSSDYMPPWCDREWLELAALIRRRPASSESIEPGILGPRPFDLKRAREIANGSQTYCSKYSIFDNWQQGMSCLYEAKDLLVYPASIETIRSRLTSAIAWLNSFREKVYHRGLR
jgi:hypothetical protein